MTEQLEDAVRSMLLERGPVVASKGATPILEIDRRVRRIRLRRRWAAIASAVAVVGISGIGVQAALRSGHSPDQLVQAQGSPTVGGQPAQTVTWNDVTVQVPKAWKLNATSCGTPIANTVIFATDEAVPLCQLDEPRELTVVRLLSTAHWPGSALESSAQSSEDVDGYSARAGEGDIPGTAESGRFLVIPDVGVAISVSSPDTSLARAILQSVTVTPGQN